MIKSAELIGKWADKNERQFVQSVACCKDGDGSLLKNGSDDAITRCQTWELMWGRHVGSFWSDAG